jgi:hypothetical protein
MLIEALTWLSTSCLPEARRFGYLREAIALQARARRCREAWHDHLELCHTAVRASIAGCAKPGKAVVLGSGTALEYPLAELSQRFNEVLLADIVHLRPIRKLARKFPNVRLVEIDLTGTLASLSRLGKTATVDGLNPLIEAAPTIPDALGEADWVLSCNLLTQLPILPTAWLRRRCPGISEYAIDRYGRSLMTRHLDLMATLAPEGCLIADLEQTLRTADGRMLEHANFSMLLGDRLGRHATWEWRLVPPGERNDGCVATHRVVACAYPAKLSRTDAQ